MYNISKGQLWVIIIGSIALWLFFVAEAADYTSEWWGGVGSILVPVVTAFYIVGWKRNRSKQELDSSLFNKKIRKVFKWLFITGVVISILLGAGTYILEEVTDNKFVSSYEREQAESYVGTIARLPKHAENARTCVDDKIALNKDTRIASCKEKYDAAYAKFQNCRSQYTTFSRYECLNTFGANYEEIDCSEETVVAEIEQEARNSCFTTVYSEFMKAKSYEKRLVDKYLDKLPPEKSVLTETDLQDLYSTVPNSTLDETIKERMNEMVEEKGYVLP